MRLNGFHSVIMIVVSYCTFFKNITPPVKLLLWSNRLCEWKLRFDILMKSNM